MKLQVVRTQFGKDATNGMLFVNGYFEAFTLEDQYQEVKVHSETCIPEGSYKIKLRTVGGFNDRYNRKYPTMHKGMLQVMDVPGFQYILIHQGNTDEHTAGCLLVGETQQDLDKGMSTQQPLDKHLLVVMILLASLLHILILNT